MAAVSTPQLGIALWDLRGPVPTETARIPLRGVANQSDGMAFHGRRLAAGLHSQEVLLIDSDDIHAPSVVRSLDGYRSYVNNVAFTPDGRTLITAAQDGQVRVVALDSNVPDLRFNGPDSISNAMLIGDTVLASSIDGVLLWWPRRRGSLEFGTRPVFQIPTSRDDTILAANAAPDSAVGQWRVQPGPTLEPAGPNIVPPQGQTFSGALSQSADGSVAALGTAIGDVFLADLADRSRPVLSQPVAAFGSLVETVILAPDGRLALVGGLAAPQVTVLDTGNTSTPRVVGRIDVAGGVPSVQFLGPTTAVLGTANGDLLLVDLQTPSAPEIITTRKLFSSTVAGIAVSADGERLVAMAAANGELALVEDLTAAEELTITPFDGPTGGMYAAAWTPDGTRLSTVTTTGEVWVWDVSNRSALPQRRLTVAAQDAQLYDVRFIGGGTGLVAGGDRGRIWTWNLDPQGVIDTICGSGSAGLTETEWRRLVPDEQYRPPCD